MITFLLASYCLAFAIRVGKVSLITNVLSKLSFFRAMFACILCIGTEVGWFLALVTQFDGSLMGLREVFLLGLAAGAFCLIVEEVLEFLSSGISSFQK